MNTITITKELIKKYRLPVKAIGNWGIEDVGEEFAILRRLREDGMFASDYPKNNYKLYREVFDEISLNDEKLLTAKTSNGQTVVIARMHTEDISEPQVEKPTDETVKMDEQKETGTWKNSNIGTRKTRWIEQLLGKMKTEPFTAQFLEKIGENNFVEQVLKDTDAKRNGGKAYSSIDSAMRVWNGRIQKGYINAD